MTLQILRKSKNLTVRDLAAKMGISASYYSHLENGRREFSPELIRKCSNVLEEDIETIEILVSKINSNSKFSNSWITNLRVQNRNALTAFEDELKIEKAKDQDELINRFARFIRNNIGQSILDEFDKNHELDSAFKARYKNYITARR